MSGLILYHSEHGHTEKAAYALQREIASRKGSAEVKRMEDAGGLDPDRYDFLCFGTPVHGLVVAFVGPAKKTREFLKGLPDLKGKRVGLFATYAFHPRKTFEIMREAIRGKNCEVVGEAKAWMFRPEEGFENLAEAMLEK